VNKFKILSIVIGKSENRNIKKTEEKPGRGEGKLPGFIL
jgi:hypothetical protein